MLKRYNRLLIALHILADFLAAVAAFALAYLVRFESGLMQLTQPAPPFWRYLALAPVIGIFVVLAFQLQGVYRLRRGRTRVDDFFGVLVGTLLATLVGLVIRYASRKALGLTYERVGELEEAVASCL